MTEVIGGLIIEITQLANNFNANLLVYNQVNPAARVIVPPQVTNYDVSFCVGHPLLEVVSQRRLIRWLDAEANAGRLPNLNLANGP
jgi:hypothetical protein